MRSADKAKVRDKRVYVNSMCAIKFSLKIQTPVTGTDYSEISHEAVLESL